MYVFQTPFCRQHQHSTHLTTMVIYVRVLRVLLSCTVEVVKSLVRPSELHLQAATFNESVWPYLRKSQQTIDTERQQVHSSLSTIVKLLQNRRSSWRSQQENLLWPQHNIVVVLSRCSISLSHQLQQPTYLPTYALMLTVEYRPQQQSLR